MQRFIIPLVLALATSVKTVKERSWIPSHSVASESQIKLAIENDYDDTGPGAKTPQYAYNTYKTLEEALLSYMDDPDTELPESERRKAINRLINSPKEYQPYISSQPIREYPKSVAEYTGYKELPQIPPIVLKKYSRPEKQVLYQNPKTTLGVYNLRGISLSNFNSVASKGRPQVYKLERVRLPGPIRSHISDFYNINQDRFTNPQYSFSQDVYNKLSGDLKSARDTRDGDSVRGFYSFVDADGRQRIIHYTGDDRLGFKADRNQRDHQ
ncbi:unnamed protein product [Parnassius apollo]|uniref:(apollo) hypothetical protein n=1 Tax=Parnassius apollo TaxID=110799 RepID=A0A8S3WLI8_PARAO|nr:unnamed protein product [Parnassius apollo]